MRLLSMMVAMAGVAMAEPHPRLLFPSSMEEGVKQRIAADPLAGKSEGWPALDAGALAYLADRGILCLGIDAPSIGSVRFETAMATYTAGAAKGVVFLEGLTGLGQLPEKGAYLLFAPIKLRGSRTTYGRALALLTHP